MKRITLRGVLAAAQVLCSLYLWVSLEKNFIFIFCADCVLSAAPPSSHPSTAATVYTAG